MKRITVIARSEATKQSPKFLLLALMFILFIGSADGSQNLFGKKKWWYSSTVTDADNDGDISAQQIDSAYSKKAPDATYTTTRHAVITQRDCNDGDAAVSHSAPEVCNFIDDDCDGIVDDSVPHYFFYTDANGDGFGDDAALTAFCDSLPPAGYTSQAPGTPDFVLSSTGHILNPYLWGFSGEHWFVSDNGVPYDVLGEPRFSNVYALRPRAFSYPGTPEGHYTQYLPGDTVMDRPIGNGGFNPTPTSNKTVFYGKPFSESFFPEAVELSARTGSKMVIQTPPVINRDGWLGALSYANRRAGIAAVLMFQEFNGNYVDCPMCTNGAMVRDSANKIIAITSPAFTGLAYTTDVGYSYANPYSQGNFQITGFTSSRLYYSESRSTGVRSSATAEQLFDSMNVSIARFAQKCDELSVANGLRGVAVTSWYSDGADPYGGQYVSNQTWLQAYYECTLSSIAFTNYDLRQPGWLQYGLYGRLDRLGADKPVMNLKGNALAVIAPAITSGMPLQLVSREGQILSDTEQESPVRAIGFADSAHHGFVIVINPTDQALQCRMISDNGYLAPVTKIQVLKATGWLDRSPILGEDDEVGSYTIARIEF